MLENVLKKMKASGGGGRINPLPVAVLFCAALSGNPAFAQESDEDYVDTRQNLRELVFTANRTAEDAKKTAAQITVITAEDIEKSGAENVVQVLENVPGIRFNGAADGAGSDSINMRGFSYKGVLVLVDGNKLNNPDMKGINWNTISLADIERIEVLDGSASVQYGNNAAGGVINIITKKSGKRRTAISLSGGSFFYNNASIAHFQPFGFGSFSVSANHTGTEGYRKRQASQVTNISAAGTFNIGDKLMLSLDAAFDDLYYQLPGGLTKAQFEDDPTQALYNDAPYGAPPNYVFNGGDETGAKNYSAGIGANWRVFEGLELALPLSYRGGQSKIDMASYIYPSYTNRQTNTLEARPQAKFNTSIAEMPLGILGGADFYYALLDINQFSDKAREAKTNYATVYEFTAAPYITARFEPVPSVSVSGGLRYDTAVINVDSKNTKGDKTHSAFVYEAGINVRPLEKLKLYAKYATLFRYPTTDEQAYYQGWGSGFDELEPEKGFNTEAGSAFSFNDILNISANFYFMQLEDEIDYNSVSYKNENMNKTQRIGINTALSLTPIEYISLDAAYSFVNAVFIAGDNKDKKIPLVPAHKFNAALVFKLPFGLSFGPDFEYLSARYQGGDKANAQEEIDGIFLLGAKIRYSLDKNENNFSLQITGRNLTNLKYATYVGYDSDLGISTYYPNDGLSINVQAQYRF